jgi:hypothetical protein
MDNELLKHLQHTELGQYISVLQENGYTSWSQLMTVTEEDLHRLGFRLGHRRRLQREIATVEGYPRSRALPFCQMSTTQVTSTSTGASGLSSFSGSLEASAGSRSNQHSSSKQLQKDRSHFDATKRTITRVHYNPEHRPNLIVNDLELSSAEREQ